MTVNTVAYQIRATASDEDLLQILELQRINAPESIDTAERLTQGFVTVRHDLELLRAIAGPWGHMVASPSGSAEVVAYALVMLRQYSDRIEVLKPMFRRLEGLECLGQPLSTSRWYAMGQLCVAKAHRGQGLVELLYAGHRARMSSDFDFMITEIDRSNTRSVRVHARAGCVVIDEFSTDDGREWQVVALDLRGGNRAE
jgi:hypothetical protein